MSCEPDDRGAPYIGGGYCSTGSREGDNERHGWACPQHGRAVYDPNAGVLCPLCYLQPGGGHA